MIRLLGSLRIFFVFHRTITRRERQGSQTPDESGTDPGRVPANDGAAYPAGGLCVPAGAGAQG